MPNRGRSLTMLLFFSLMAHILCEIRQLWCAIVLIPCIIPLCWSKGTKGNDEEMGKGGVKEGVCGYGAKGGKAHLPTNTQRRKAAFVMMIMRKIMIDLQLSSQLSSRRLPSRLHSVCVCVSCESVFGVADCAWCLPSPKASPMQ